MTNVVSQSITEGNYLYGKIVHINIRILIDSGAVQSLISETFAKRLNLKIQPLLQNDSTYLFAAEGSRLHVKGFIETNINFSGLLIPCRLLIITNLGESVLLGTDFLKENGVVLDYCTGQATIYGNLLTLPLLNNNKKQFMVRVAKNTFLPPFSETIVPIKCHHQFNNRTVFLDAIPSIQFQNFAVARSINNISQCQTFCRILNFQQEPVVLRRGKVVATVSHANNCQLSTFKSVVNTVNTESNTSVKLSEPQLLKFAEEYKFKISDSLPHNEKILLLQLLYKYKDVFARNLSEIKGYKNFELDLELKEGAKPIYNRQFRLKPEDQKIMQKQLDEMVNNNLMTEAQNCEWNSCGFL